MIKNDNKKASSANSLVSQEHSIREFEIFKSRVANAVLDFMEAQSDLDLLACLEKSSFFLTNISVQMEKVFDDQTQAVTMKMMCLKSVTIFSPLANTLGQTRFTKTSFYALHENFPDIAFVIIMLY